MAEKTLNTIIALRYDTYANWKQNNPVLKKGEVAIAAVPNNQDGVQNAPSILIKVGDGELAYNALNFASGLAADVHTWAKAENKPTYKADEITGIDTYISEYVNEQMGISVDTDTQYNITKVNDYQYKLMSKSKADTGFTTEVAVIDIPAYDDSALAGRVTAVEGLVGSTAVATQIANAIAALDLANTYEAKGTAATEAGKVQTALNEYKTTNDAAVKANSDAITAIKDGTSIDSFADVESALAGKQDTIPANTYDAYGAASTAEQNAKGYADEKLAEFKTQNVDPLAEDIETAQGDITALTNKVGTVPADKTVVQMIEDAKTSATYDDTALTQRVAANETAIGTLNANAETAGSVDYKIAQAVAAIMENPDETMNSINELVTWCNDHAADALELSNKVSANEGDIAALEGLVGTTAVATQITDAIAAALKIDGVDKYALASDLTAAIARIAAMEAKVTKWDAAEQNAKDYTDTQLANYYKKSEVDSTVNSLTEIVNGKADKATTLAGYGITDAYTKTEVNTELAKKANDADLAAIAKTGNVNDLVQTEGDVLILNCGDSNV